MNLTLQQTGTLFKGVIKLLKSMPDRITRLDTSNGYLQEKEKRFGGICQIHIAKVGRTSQRII